MQIPIYQMDAFAAGLFRGNPAAICPLDRWLPDSVMQSIAAENNLAETAFYVPAGTGKYELRWFTPAVEVDLCGHATLASAAVILEVRREVAASRVVFASRRSGELPVDRDGERYTLDFPSWPPEPAKSNVDFASALGVKPTEVLAAQDYLCVFSSEQEVRKIEPDMAQLAKIDRFAVIVTAPGEDCDFVSRFFAPAKGVPEDPVTGRAHTTLTPYWSKRLGKSSMFARQVSRRGGELWCEQAANRVKIGGRVVKYLEGQITIPG